MARYGLTLDNPLNIAKAHTWLDRAIRKAWRVEFKEPKRSDAQNDRMWEMLDRVSKRMTIGGKSFEPEAWKCIFMKAMGKEAQFLPTLDGASFFPTGFRSSDLSVREMSDMQTFIEAWCAERGVDLWGEVAA
jgi:hypothetical protein